MHKSVFFNIYIKVHFNLFNITQKAIKLGETIEETIGWPIPDV